jgi:hypothetical protein
MIKSLYNKVKFYFLKRKAENSVHVTYDRFGSKRVRYFYTDIYELSLLLNDKMDKEPIDFFMGIRFETFKIIFETCSNPSEIVKRLYLMRRHKNSVGN